jgi:SAM-dependent methyltransferase
MSNGERAPNRDQAVQWNTSSGRTWAELQDVLDRLFAPFEALLVEEAFPGEGARVLDVGCGAGATTLAMARRLGQHSTARCVGVDLSAQLVEVARARAAAEGLSTATFVEADAQTHAFAAGAFDAVISRFGVMFFDDPEAAFATLRRAARPRAKLVFVAWRRPAENPFMTAAVRAAAPLLPIAKTENPEAPGQFAFADGGRVRRILEASGWKDVEVAPLDLPCSAREQDLNAYAAKLGPVGRALRDVDEATRARVVDAVRRAYEPWVRDGAAHFTAACWLVRAT